MDQIILHSYMLKPALEDKIPEWKKARQARAHAVSHRKRLLLKKQVVARYGGRCDWCHENDIDVLCIDHIDNDGAEHRRELGYKGASTYKWLKRHGYPPGFQVLCANCNWLKELELRRERELSTARSTVAGRESKERSRLDALRHYSEGKMTCSECGETNIDLLTFHHPTESYKEDESGLRIVGYLKKNNYPDGYTVVCLNCSMKNRNTVPKSGQAVNPR